LPGDRFHDRIKAAFEEATLFDVEDRLQEIRAPTLVIGGCNDPIVPLEESMAFHKGIPDSSMLVLEHSGHGAEGADEAIFRDTVLRFLSQLKR
jgi:pimeloyl-ACP methyl ester carboxylesterase